MNASVNAGGTRKLNYCRCPTADNTGVRAPATTVHRSAAHRPACRRYFADSGSDARVGAGEPLSCSSLIRFSSTSASRGIYANPPKVAVSC
jgi:hypothetical protein